MGLLDTFLGNADQTQALGLLGAHLMAGNAPGGFQAASGLLADAPRRRMQEELLRAQIGDTQAQAQERAAKIKQQEQQMQEQARWRELIGNAGRPAPGMGATGAVNAALPPEMQIGAQPQIGGGGIDYRSLFQQGVPFEMVKQLAETQNLGLPEVARVLTEEGPGGAKLEQQRDKFGRPVGPAINGYVAPVAVGQGDRTTFVKPAAGMSLPMNMTFSDKNAAANLALSRQRLALDQGNAEQGKWQYDAQRGGLVNMQSGEFKPAMQGGQPIETKASREAAKEGLQRRSAIENAGSVLKEVQDAKGMVGWNTAGVGGSLAFLPATDARNLGAKLQTIKANLGFDRLQQMRADSPTGGALGQVAVQELAALQATVASLDQMQSPAQLGTALDKIETHYTRWKNVMEQANSGQGGASGGWGIKEKK